MSETVAEEKKHSIKDLPPKWRKPVKWVVYIGITGGLIVSAWQWLPGLLKKEKEKGGVSNRTSGAQSPAGSDNQITYYNNFYESQKPLKDVVDLTTLGKHYPFGFMVFRKGKFDNQWVTSGEGEIQWDIDLSSVKFEITAENQIHTVIRIRSLWDPKRRLRMRNNLVESTTPNTLHLVSQIRGLAELDQLLFLEVLENNPRDPIYVLGLGNQATLKSLHF